MVKIIQHWPDDYFEEKIDEDALGGEEAVTSKDRYQGVSVRREMFRDIAERRPGVLLEAGLENPCRRVEERGPMVGDPRMAKF